METNYIKTFFELEIKIINEKEFYYNGIQFINLNDFTKYLKNISNSYSEYILNKSLLLIDENRNIYLNHKISILKTHSESLNFIFDNFKINSTINAIKTPYSSILLDIKILKNQKQIDLFYEIYLQIKTISLKCIFDIASQLKNITPQQSETKTDKLKAPVLGLFCSLINKIGIDKKDETESATVYCERICGNFKLPYTDRVRQNYNVNENKKLIKELTEKVLPLIDNETKILVEKYLDNKQPPKQNLYA
jgi:hypothetical protein